MGQKQLTKLAQDLKYVSKGNLKGELRNVVAAQRHLQRHGVSDFDTRIPLPALLERIQSLFPKQAQRYQEKINEVEELRRMERAQSEPDSKEDLQRQIDRERKMLETLNAADYFQTFGVKDPTQADRDERSERVISSENRIMEL